MREEELDIRSSNKTVMLDGEEEQVLVRWFWEEIRNCVKIVYIQNGRDCVYNDLRPEDISRLRKEIKREYQQETARRVVQIAGKQTLYPGGLP